MGKKREYYDIKRPKKSVTLTNVLSKNEIIQLLSCTNNTKHRALLTLVSSAGLRLSELINLRIEDIHSNDGCILVKAANGKKDRKTLLSPSLLPLLRNYYKL